jgi:hypothetical protein
MFSGARENYFILSLYVCQFYSLRLDRHWMRCRLLVYWRTYCILWTIFTVKERFIVISKVGSHTFLLNMLVIEILWLVRCLSVKLIFSIEQLILFLQQLRIFPSLERCRIVSDYIHPPSCCTNATFVLIWYQLRIFSLQQMAMLR